MLEAGLPVWRPPFDPFVNLQQQLRGVDGRGGVGVQQELLVLRQVLGGALLGHAGTVEKFPLQQGQVGLSRQEKP